MLIFSSHSGPVSHEANTTVIAHPTAIGNVKLFLSALGVQSGIPDPIAAVAIEDLLGMPLGAAPQQPVVMQKHDNAFLATHLGNEVTWLYLEVL